MKKAVVIFIIALVAVASAFAFEFKSVGIETGEGLYASADMEIIDNLDIYGRIGANGYFSISALPSFCWSIGLATFLIIPDHSWFRLFRRSSC